MTVIAEIKFGAHLYGTATPKSDLDLKTVFIPPAQDIILQRIIEHNRTDRPKTAGEKNTAEDIDHEYFSLHRYLTLLAEGHTLALDMLFAPAESMVQTASPIWHDIVANRERLLSRKVVKFVHYCETQAKKYGIKGSRIHAVRHLLRWFAEAIDEHGPKTRLDAVMPSLTAMVQQQQLQHTRFVPITQVGGQVIMHLECCDLKASARQRLDDACMIYQRVMDRYGQRALQAECNENIDWKALSHSVRIGTEAIELLETGWITFPRPDAAHLLNIKLGQLPFKVVAEEIERLLDEVKAAQTRSSLPEEPDHSFIDAFVAKVYSDTIIDVYS
jgi:hypothetical protein